MFRSSVCSANRLLRHGLAEKKLILNCTSLDSVVIGKLRLALARCRAVVAATAAVSWCVTDQLSE